MAGDDLGLTVTVRNTGSRPGREVVQAYLEVLHQAQKTSNGMTNLVKLDAEIIKETKVKENAEAVVKGIWWKWLSRRRRRGILSWDAFERLLKRYVLPNATVVHSVSHRVGEPAT